MNESGENYLETILILEKEMGTFRSIDVARRLSYSKPSVSRAMKILTGDGFITIGDDGSIRLTRSGRQKAEGIYEKHQTLTSFLVETAGVSPAIAEEDACRIEHIISEETFDGIRKYMNTK